MGFWSTTREYRAPSHLWADFRDGIGQKSLISPRLMYQADKEPGKTLTAGPSNRIPLSFQQPKRSIWLIYSMGQIDTTCIGNLPINNHDFTVVTVVISNGQTWNHLLNLWGFIRPRGWMV